MVVPTSFDSSAKISNVSCVAVTRMECRYLACSELSSDSFEPSLERSLEMGSISSLLWNRSIEVIPSTKTFMISRYRHETAIDQVFCEWRTLNQAKGGNILEWGPYITFPKWSVPRSYRCYSAHHPPFKYLPLAPVRCCTLDNRLT